MKVYEMTIADIASEIFDKGEDFAEKIFNDIDELEKNKLLEIDQLKQQVEEKNKEIERLRKNHRISYTNQKKAYENLKNSVNAKSLIKYPIKLDGCLIKDEQDLFDYAKESTRDIIYLRNERTKFAIAELEKVKVNLKDRISMMNNEEHSYLQKVVSWYDICEQVNKQIKELKGEKDVTS